MEMKAQASRPLPRVSEFSDYRAFLRDFFEFKKSTRAGFSFRRFAGLCGLKSPNYLQLVIQGKRSLTPDTAAQIAKAMKLNSAEMNYFVALVERDSARNPEEEKQAEKELHRAIKGLKTRFVEKNEMAVFEDWHYFAVRELALLKDFEATGEYVASRLSGLITSQQGERALKFLIDQGYLVHQGGRYVVKDPVLDAGNDIFMHERMQRFHSKVLGLWSGHLSELSPRDQELGLLNIPVPASQIPELRLKIRQFQDEIIGWVQSFENNETLVQLGTYLMVFEKKDL
ncbi:MAG: TIGR02147 family protein [Bdellovibrionaceae bacterium]|nr:TIGR02147 family protein [Pseudobdellovibrionaceae bacterium]MBX3034938.1 TIGR02147 family protein [Pseudobdellovibrionaceae bacterium]